MDLATCEPDMLPRAVVEGWSQAVREQSLSPYLSPEFAQLVHQVRGDVRVIYGTHDDRFVLAWPMQQRRRFMAEPVGFGLADAQGMCLRDDSRISPGAILRASGNLT
ncbi:MAG: hypothetical protein WCI74_08730, partial [Actinomycetes bacterium]